MAEEEKLTKLERLQKQQKQITEQIRKEQNRVKTRARKADTRKKIIMGSLVLSHMEKDAEFKAVCERLQREGIKGKTERELFGLPPLPEVKKD